MIDSKSNNTHILFVDDEDQVESFDPSSNLNNSIGGSEDSAESETKFKGNRDDVSIILITLSPQSIFDYQDMDYINWQKEHSYKELYSRIRREKKIRILEQTVSLNRQILVCCLFKLLHNASY